MEILKEYTHISGMRVKILKGDAFEVSSDALVIGKNKAFRDFLESFSGENFKDYSHTVMNQRQIQSLVSEKLPWHKVFSIHYSPRNVKINSMHIFKLKYDLHSFLYSNLLKSKFKNILMMPLSCRNSKVIAVTYALMLYEYAYSIASILEKTPCDRGWKISCKKIEKCMIEKFPTERDRLKKEFADERELDQKRLKMFEQKYGNESITIIDKDDPTPFIDAIENKGGCLSQYYDSFPGKQFLDVLFEQV
ncbi:MAG: hypothetical protein ACYTEU_14775 [Planctomycetota bacterium]|jgi:hypothetical protein